jgi:hypothetical protein
VPAVPFNETGAGHLLLVFGYNAFFYPNNCLKYFVVP